MFLLMQNVKNLLTCKSFLLRCITLYVKLKYETVFICDMQIRHADFPGFWFSQKNGAFNSV